ncbi:MAG: hypothetical protein JG782_1938 [Anaerophaga sp.]|nr:hypothetical protein [Anaerophaga sp.]MDN5292635.1 hypothetical protein [Anaerophaga sp.]
MTPHKFDQLFTYSYLPERCCSNRKHEENTFYQYIIDQVNGSHQC